MSSLVPREFGLVALFAIALAGCGPHVASDPRPSPIASDPVPSGYALQGLVFDAYTGPVANQAVGVVVTPNGRNDPDWSLAKFVFTDSAGRFEFTGLPDSKVFLWAGNRERYVQPCAITLDVRADVTHDVEIVATETLNSLAAPRPLTAREPAYTGTVFEMTAAGRQPVAGAVIEAYQGDYVRAHTVTDLSGRYFLCDLPPLPPNDTELDVVKDGYTFKFVWPVDASQSMTLDIEIERK